MKKQRILVVSSANIDFVQRMRRVPYAGETVSEPELKYSYVPGGKGANSAIAFARFGADCVFVVRCPARSCRTASQSRSSHFWTPQRICT